MALVVYVMPLWRYLAGDFEDPPPAARDGSGGAGDAGRDRRAIRPTRARQFVRHLRGTFHGLTRGVSRWRDEGDVAFAAPFDVAAWRGLQAFAADQQYPVPTFHFGANAELHPGLRAIWEGAASAYPHLIRHHANSGFYLPVDFARPVELAMGADAGNTVVAGSSVALLKELNLLGPRMGMERDLGDLAAAGEHFAARGGPLARVRYGWAFMRQVARLSVERRLPIVFDG